MKSIGILTTISANHGSSIFNHGLNAIFKDSFPLAAYPVRSSYAYHHKGVYFFCHCEGGWIFDKN